jgi:nicotinamide riboside transporter PnuC
MLHLDLLVLCLLFYPCGWFTWLRTESNKRQSLRSVVILELTGLRRPMERPGKKPSTYG